MSGKFQVKDLILKSLFYSGFFGIWLKFRPKSVTFIMLHGVMDAEDKSAQWEPFRSYLSRRNLDASLRVISRYYAFISIDEAIERLEGKLPLDKHYCVITFDDGQRNNVTHAMPVLRRYHAPAVLYVVPKQAEIQEPFWFDRLDFAIQQAFPSLKELTVFDKTFSLKQFEQSDLKPLFLKIKAALFSSNHPYEQTLQELDRIIDELERVSGKSLLEIYPNDPWSKVMDWEEIRQASQESDITIGSHTQDHSLLGLIDEDEVLNQLVKSKQEIERHTQKPCVHFCYPNGSIPKNPEKLLEVSGYVSAVTTKTGVTYGEQFSRYLIERYHITAHRNEFFNLALICGFASTAYKLTRKMQFWKKATPAYEKNNRDSQMLTR